MAPMAPAAARGYRRPVRDRHALPLIALAATAMIALALVWPQGQGRQSPAPFGRPMTVRQENTAQPGRTPAGLRSSLGTDDTGPAAPPRPRPQP